MAEVLALLREFGRDIGLAGMMVLVLIGGYKRWWIFGWQYREMRRDRDEWRRLALQGSQLADKALRTGESKVVPDPHDG